MDPEPEMVAAEEKEKADKDAVADGPEDSEANLAALAKARRWDEYKDEHRRGWGNRMNRS